MPTIAVIGAGPGLGLSIAKRFGREGFAIGLISRSQTNLDALAADLDANGIEAAGFAADATDAAALGTAIEQLTERFGPIDVLSFSPSAPDNPDLQPVPVTEVRNLRQPRHDAGLRQHRHRRRRPAHFALSLHAAVAEQGVHVAHIPLNVWIAAAVPETQPDTIAEHYWNVHTSREGAEHPYVAL